jgi:hypothetical protein
VLNRSEFPKIVLWKSTATTNAWLFKAVTRRVKVSQGRRSV